VKIPDPKEKYHRYLLYLALRAGIPFAEISDMSADEIVLATQVKRELDEKQAQMQAWLIYNSAALTAVAVNDPKRFPKLGEAFPSLFEKKDQQDWRVMKARMEAYAIAKNTNYV